MTTVLENAGGMEQYFIDTAKELSKIDNAAVDIITRDDRFTAKLEGLLDIYYMKKARDSNNKKREKIHKTLSIVLGNIQYYKVSSWKTLANTLKKYDVVYAKNELLEAAILKFIIGYRNIPPVVFCCATPLVYPYPRSLQEKLHNFLYRGKVYAFLVKGAAAFHTKNIQDEQVLKKMFPKKRVVKIANAINIPVFIEQAKTHVYPYEWSPNKYNIVWVGRLTLQKGIDRLITVIKTLNHDARYREAIFWHIVGEGEEKEMLIKEVGTCNNVHLHGHVSHEQMPSIYSQCNLLISTSRWESFGLTLIEANACGLPAIAYNISGPNEIIVRGENGFLIDNEQEMVTTIKSLVDHKLHCADPAKIVRAKFNSQQHGVQIYDLLRYATG